MTDKPPPGLVPYMASMFAFVAVYPDDAGEGIVAAQSPNGPMPLIAASRERLDALTPIAEKMARDCAGAGIKIKLVEFAARIDMREITGHGMN